MDEHYATYPGMNTMHYAHAKNLIFLLSNNWKQSNIIIKYLLYIVIIDTVSNSWEGTKYLFLT